MTNFDPSLFEVDIDAQESVKANASGLHFLAATDLHWLMTAAQLRGRACQLALALKLQWDLAGRREFAMQSKLSASFGVDRYAERRALLALRDAGLLAVTQRRGVRPRVTLIGADVAQRGRSS